MPIALFFSKAKLKTENLLHSFPKNTHGSRSERKEWLSLPSPRNTPNKDLLIFIYRLPYMTIFGGVSAMTREQMLTVNGYPNKFFGWGGEDDEMYNR